MRTAREVVNDFIKEAKFPYDPYHRITTDSRLVAILCAWFDEHDSTEQLAEYLVYCLEERRAQPKSTLRTSSLSK